MSQFDPNDHSAKYKFIVYVKRIGKELDVTSVRALYDRDLNAHLWGFADDDGSLVEWDVTWGDLVRTVAL